MLERELEKVPWTPRQTLIGILLTLLPWLVFSLLLSTTSSTTPLPTHISVQQDVTTAIVGLIISLISEGIFLLAPFYFANRTTSRAITPPSRRRRSILDTLGFRRFPLLRSLALVAIFFVGLIIVNQLYALLITDLHLQIQTNDQVVLERGRTLPIATYVTLVAAVVIAPICEEIFFRSFILMGLLGDMTPTLAIFLSALIFAVAHADPASFLVLFVIGLALAVLRWRTRSIWPGIFLHMLNNGTSALLIVLSLHGVQI